MRSVQLTIVPNDFSVDVDEPGAVRVADVAEDARNAPVGAVGVLRRVR